MTIFGSVGGFLFLSAALAAAPSPEEKPLLRFGMVTDVHSADREDSPWNGITMYRRAKGRLTQAMDVFCARRPDFLIELGDFKDIALKPDPKPGEDPRDKEGTIRLTREVEEIFSRFDGPRYHVFGNHDNDMLDKAEFAAICPNPGVPADRTYYSFSRAGITFVVLDGNFNKAGESYTGSTVNWVWSESVIPPEELTWLEKTLAEADGRVIVFVHQRLDSHARPDHRILNAEDVQRALSASGKVIGVFQGHDHVGGHTVEGGICYYTLRAMAMGPDPAFNGFAEAAVYPSGTISVTGFAQAESVTMGEGK